MIVVVFRWHMCVQTKFEGPRGDHDLTNDMSFSDLTHRPLEVNSLTCSNCYNNHLYDQLLMVGFMYR